MTTGSAINPKKAFGKPSNEAPTTLHEIFALMSHEKVASGFAANVMASDDRTSEATNAKIEDTSISEKAPM